MNDSKPGLRDSRAFEEGTFLGNPPTCNVQQMSIENSKRPEIVMRAEKTDVEEMSPDVGKRHPKLQ